MIPPAQRTVTAKCGCVVGRENLAILTSCPALAALEKPMQDSATENDGIMTDMRTLPAYRDHLLDARDTVRRTEQKEKMQAANAPHIEDLKMSVDGADAARLSLVAFQRGFDGDVDGAIRTLRRYVHYITEAIS